MMELSEFKRCVDLYSADLARWPQALMKPALALVDGDAEARQYLKAMQAVDGLLRGYTPREPDLAALERRILSDASRLPLYAEDMPPVFARWNPAYLFAPGGGLLAAAIIGFYMGLNPATQADIFLTDPVAYAQEEVLGDDLEIYNGEIF